MHTRTKKQAAATHELFRIARTVDVRLSQAARGLTLWQAATIANRVRGSEQLELALRQFHTAFF